jgi:D-lyxose ketol-isomerase
MLQPGEQYTILPNTLHWFQAGDNGAIIVDTQLIKQHVLPIQVDGEHIPNFNIIVGHNHPIDQQFHQLALLCKGRLR